MSAVSQSSPRFAIAGNTKSTCEHPEYLFWKLQSKLAKLSLKLHHLEHQSRQNPQPKPAA